MRFTHARCPKNQDVVGLREKPGGGELADRPLVDRRLEFEIEVVSTRPSAARGDLTATPKHQEKPYVSDLPLTKVTAAAKDVSVDLNDPRRADER